MVARLVAGEEAGVQWLRENPHRFSLARLGSVSGDTGGNAAAFTDLAATRQTLDMWTGRLEQLRVRGVPVKSKPRVHPDRDHVIVRFRSACWPMAASVSISGFPASPRSSIPIRRIGNIPKRNDQEMARSAGGLTLARQLDDTRYSVRRCQIANSTLPSPRRTRIGSRRPVPCRLTLLVGFPRRRRRRRCRMRKRRITRRPGVEKVSGRKAAWSTSPGARIRAQESWSDAW